MLYPTDMRPKVVYSLLASLVGGIVLVPSNPASGAGEPPQIRAAIKRGSEYLLKNLAGYGVSGEGSLALLALVKAGYTPENTPAVNALVAKTVAQKFAANKYRPGSHGVYEAGVDAMLLYNADAVKYKPQIQLVVNYLIGHQAGGGSWDYIGQNNGGDTSQSQYALLALWAAQRAKVPVPDDAVRRAMNWFLQTQQPDGGFRYHPRGSENHPANISMTTAGTASITLARMLLYPQFTPKAKKDQKKPSKKYGVLEKVNLDESKGGAGPGNKPMATPPGNLTSGIQRGLGWMGARFVVHYEDYPFYYLYSIERMAALLDTKTIGNHDWYAEGSAFALRTQGKDGAWKVAPGPEVEQTCFAILFLVRATGKALGTAYGQGLLAGARGLKDLENIGVEEGKVKKKKDLGPIDSLLEELASMDALEIEEAQAAIVEKVQLGDREELIKQKPQLVKLVDHKEPEIRRTVVWALGRSDDIRMARLLIGRLKNDNQLDVMIEARNSLCSLARKPSGFGKPVSPFEGVEVVEDLSQDERDDRIIKWRAEVFGEWSEWYLRVRPFDERDMVSPFDRKYEDKLGVSN